MTEVSDDAHTELLGAPLDRVETPAALLDMDLFERNARYIYRFLADHDITWRPHIKAHKSPYLAKLQLRIGAVGITCAKLSEAEVMVAAGIGDVLIANQLGTPEKWRRAAELQQRARVIVCVDDVTHLRWASQTAVAAGVTIPLLIEVDLGMRRCGVGSSQRALELADRMRELPGIRLAGVMGYEGHLLTVWPWEEKVARCSEALNILVDAADKLRAAGHPVDVVSSGGSGSFEATAEIPQLTECQAGGGCLMDRFYAEECHVDLEPALTLLTTTISVQASGRAIVDAGFKALGRLGGFALPRVLDRPGVEFAALSAEHGILTVDNNSMRVGDRVEVIPGYSDAILVLHDYLIGHRREVVSDAIPLLARGRLA